ncbi:MAG TPA: hypothetical protein VME44_25320 [Streptosporangiaceae bacterium]|nr:hypothetical protein [Streptosporangiaceae bacterium]
MNWLWLNIPLMAVFFLAVAGIPLWLVLRRPDFAAAPADQRGQCPVATADRTVPASPEARPRELVSAAR